MSLHTKNGVPLVVEGHRVYNPDGENFGQVRGDRVYDLGGRYRGTIVSDRLIYRSTESATVVGSSAQAANRPGSARAHQAGSADWGDEPDIKP
jgi:hypothetical protein